MSEDVVSTWRFAAEVDRIYGDDSLVDLWIAHEDKIVSIEIPKNMPDWARKEKVGFLALIPIEQQYSSDYSNITWLGFEPLPFESLSDDELLDCLEGRADATSLTLQKLVNEYAKAKIQIDALELLLGDILNGDPTWEDCGVWQQARKRGAFVGMQWENDS